jgi:hypothetical protein
VRTAAGSKCERECTFQGEASYDVDVTTPTSSLIPRPRTIVTADPELDDLNSMIRFLLYSNEVEVAGLIYASSRFHWRGDGRGTTFFLPERE